VLDARRLIALLVLLLLWGPVLALAQEEQGRPAAPPSAQPAARPSGQKAATTAELLRPRVVGLQRPGSKAAARLAPSLNTSLGAFVKSPDGLYVPDRRIMVSNRKMRERYARWAATGKAVVHELQAGGARLAPAEYQNMVEKIFQRSEKVLNKLGLSAAGWEMGVLEGGQASGVNAFAAMGGVIVVNRDLVDTAFRLGSAVATAQNRAEVDRNVADLLRWERGKASKPKFLGKKLSPFQNRLRAAIADTVVSATVNHELGHALLGHVELKDSKIWLPNSYKPFDAKHSRGQERQADAFAVLLGAAGGSAMPSAVPLLDYYFHVRNPQWVDKGPKDIVDWRSHPNSASRYTDQLDQLSKLGFKISDRMPAPLRAGQLVGPDGRQLHQGGSASAAPNSPGTGAASPNPTASQR
jgi:Zn-dependent protease with chaperone function